MPEKKQRTVPNVAALRRLQLRRRSQIQARRQKVTLAQNKEANHSISNGKINDILERTINTTVALPSAPPMPPPPSPKQARKSLILVTNRRASQKACKQDQQRAKGRRRSLKLDSSMIVNGEISTKRSKDAYEGELDEIRTLIRKKILQRQDRERLLLFLNKSGESILQENGEPNEKFVDWRKVQTFVWQSYRKSSPI